MIHRHKLTSTIKKVQRQNRAHQRAMTVPTYGAGAAVLARLAGTVEANLSPSPSEPDGPAGRSAR